MMTKKKFTIVDFKEQLHLYFGGDTESLFSPAYRFIGHHSQLRKYGFNSLGRDYDCDGDTALPKKLYNRHLASLFENYTLPRQTGKQEMTEKFKDYIIGLGRLHFD